MGKFRKGDYVKFTAHEGYDCHLYVNDVMEKYLRGKIFRVKSVDGFDIEIETCDLTANRSVTRRNMDWGYTTDMFSYYEPVCKPETMEFTYEQLLAGGGDEK